MRWFAAKVCVLLCCSNVQQSLSFLFRSLLLFHRRLTVKLTGSVAGFVLSVLAEGLSIDVALETGLLRYRRRTLDVVRQL